MQQQLLRTRAAGYDRLLACNMMYPSASQSACSAASLAPTDSWKPNLCFPRVPWKTRKGPHFPSSWWSTLCWGTVSLVLWTGRHCLSRLSLALRHFSFFFRRFFSLQVQVLYRLIWGWRASSRMKGLLEDVPATKGAGHDAPAGWLKESFFARSSILLCRLGLLPLMSSGPYNEPLPYSRLAS